MSQPQHVDPRAMRFSASITSVVLAAALLASPPVAAVLMVAQATVFAVAALVDMRLSPYALVFAQLVRPRVGAPVDVEDVRPPRFAQFVGLGFAMLALVGLATGASALFLAATAMALVAALLNATVGFCLGCEMYLLGRRFLPSRS